jgi:hypothetical protein
MKITKINTLFFLVLMIFSTPLVAQKNIKSNKKFRSNTTRFGVYPLAVPEQNSLMAQWEKKPVLQSQLIDDMEQDGNWKVTSIGKMSYTQDRAKDGKRSLRFSTSIRDTAFLRLPGNLSAWGSQRFNINGQAGASSVQLRFDKPQDWSGFNRISFWVYVHTSSMPRHNINLEIINDGTLSTALTTSRTHYNNDLKPGMWNHVLFEMPHLQRDKVSMFILTRELTGNNPGEDDIVTYDFDKLELQRVVADQYEGWTVASEKFAFSHIGYRPTDAKIAMVGNGASDKFQLVNEANKVVFSGNVKSVENKNGVFAQLDFSKFQTAGVYRIRCGSLESNSFPINENIWLQPTFKAVNFYFCERCGFEVLGIHKACHMDWQGFRGDVKKVVNGGYHDAGDLSQGIWRTSMAAFGLLQNLDVLKENKEASEVKERMRSEVEWALQYLLKTRFGDGFHIHWCRMRMFTDNKIGTIDDVVVPAENIPWENFLAAAVESKAAALFENSNPELALQARAAAIDDWNAGVASSTTWDQASFEEASWGATSSLLLAKMTGDDKYKKQAVVFGNLIVKCQEQSFVNGIPITGYFYSNTDNKRVIHNKHTAFEEAPMIALSLLCKELPENENWIKWYSSAVLYSDYFMKRGSVISAPYNLLPNSVWTKAEIMEDKNEKSRATSLQQFNEGTRLNDETVLRTFPIWSDATFHGNTNVQLSNTWALAEASNLRNDTEGMKLVGKQLEWVMGANPFGQSLMYGSGYDFAPQFAYCQKDMVGSLPVGMDCMSGDKPYWPATNSATYKEIWMEPVNRFMGAVSAYTAQNQSLSASQQSAKNAEIQVQSVYTGKVLTSATLIITGTGKHNLEVKAFNASVNIASKQIDLSANKSETIQLDLNIADKNKPYVVVVSLDKNPNSRKEIVGAYSNSSILVKN